MNRAIRFTLLSSLVLGAAVPVVIAGCRMGDGPLMHSTLLPTAVGGLPRQSEPPVASDDAEPPAASTPKKRTAAASKPVAETSLDDLDGEEW